MAVKGDVRGDGAKKRGSCGMDGPPAKYANGAVFRLWATYLPTFPGVVPVVIPELERPGGLSFPLRLRGSGSLALLFHASIRLIMWSFIAIVCLGCQG